LYGVAGSLAGTTPGFDVGGLHVPLNLDPYFFISLGGTTPIVGGIGFLDTTGQATAVFDLPLATNPVLVGFTVNHAFVALDPLTGALRAVSNPVAANLVN
jgi:hypothetical protein